MENNLNSYIISTLQMEYNSHRQELCDILKSMDFNYNIGTTMLTGSVGITSLLNNEKYLYVIPSIVFISVCIHLLKTASANIHGTYCQAIEMRFKMLLGEKNVLMDWEGGKISYFISNPKSIVQIGFYIFFLGIVVLFFVYSIKAYKWAHWTAIVHVVEFVIDSIYAIYAIRWNTSAGREEIIRHYSEKKATLLETE